MTDNSGGCGEGERKTGLPLPPSQEDLQQGLAGSPTTLSMANTDTSTTDKLKQSPPPSYKAVVYSASRGRNRVFLWHHGMGCTGVYSASRGNIADLLNLRNPQNYLAGTFWKI